jgi:catechol 2,3-dioxygenase-like lactoylglutathione lyase family enzyme
VHAELHTEGANLAIFSAAGMECMAPGSMRAAGHGGVTIGFEVDDVDAEVQKLKSLGIPLVKQPETHPWGARSTWFRDPDGNLIDFFTILGE